MALQFKKLTVHIAEGGETFQLAMLQGVEPAALLDAARGRVGQGVTDTSVFFTTGPDPAGVVVPLSAALPDGAELTLHCRPGPDDTALPSTQDGSKGGQQREQVASGSASRRGRSGGPTSRHQSGGAPVPREVSEVSVMTAGSEFDTQASGVSDSLLGTATSLVAPLPGDSTTPLLRSDSLLAEETRNAGSTEKTEVPNVTELNTRGRGEEPRRSRSGSAIRRVLSPFSRQKEEMDEEQKANRETVDAIQKFSRLGTDMGNERTLLAWIRTALAAVRTLFTYYPLIGTTPAWNWTVLSAEWAMAVLCILTTVLGHFRYVRAKEAIMMKDPPFDYQRMSIRWVFYVTMISMVLSAVGSCAFTLLEEGWSK